jgi:hypothetical protein
LEDRADAPGRGWPQSGVVRLARAKIGPKVKGSASASDAANARAAYLAARAAGHSLSAAARAAGRDRDTVYDWRRDPAFRRAEQDSLDDARDRLRDLISDALDHGLEERTVHSDGSVTTRFRKSDRLLLARAVALLEEHRPAPLQIELAASPRPAVELSVAGARASWAALTERERTDWLGARGLAEPPWASSALTRLPAPESTPSAPDAEGQV